LNPEYPNISGASVTAVRFAGVTKRFPGVVALRDVSFSIASGSCHALCGENGAGKSTLGRMLAGIAPQDEGDIVLFGERRRFASPRQALAAGVAIVHQELAFCGNLSVMENLCLQDLPARNAFVARPRMRERANKLLGALDVSAATGLSETEATRRLDVYGFNKIVARRRVRTLTIILRQLRSPVVALLAAAAGVAADFSAYAWRLRRTVMPRRLTFWLRVESGIFRILAASVCEPPERSRASRMTRRS